MGGMLKILPDTFFVYIKRNPIDVALSLYHARIAYYNDPNKWLSMIPPNCDNLLNESWKVQISKQVYYLNSFYEEQLKKLSEKSFMVIEYEELCLDPVDVMKKIKEKVLLHTGYELNFNGDIPYKFEVETPSRDFNGASDLIKEVQKYFN
jgi:hypothetical protein